MIDTHCHIDQYSNPLGVANESERLGIITIGMTNLPSHFEKGVVHLTRHRKVRLALGLHPLYATFHNEEIPLFIKNISRTSYVGEVGLDFSKEGIATREIQLGSFRKVLLAVKNKKKLLSLHSRQAEKEVLELLIEHKIESAIFHWYSGPISLIDKIAENGYYFSINPHMIKSINGQKIISRIPNNKILTESDGPFIELHQRPIKPRDVSLVINYLSKTKDIPIIQMEELINMNFKRLISQIV